MPAPDGDCPVIPTQADIQSRDHQNPNPTITHIELETNPNFFDHFVEGCQFKR